MAVLATEAGLTVITSGMHFSWVGLALGVVGFCLILVLANRLYAGNRQAHTIALGWIGFQVLYAAFALYLMVSSSQGVEMAKQIGAPAAWPVVFQSRGLSLVGLDSRAHAHRARFFCGKAR